MKFCESTLLITGKRCMPAFTCTGVCAHVVSVSVFSFSIKSQSAQREKLKFINAAQTVTVQQTALESDQQTSSASLPV